MKILTAFDHMLRGIKIKISKDLRESVRGTDIGYSFFITSVNENKTVNLRGIGNSWEFQNIDLKEIEFK